MRNMERRCLYPGDASRREQAAFEPRREQREILLFLTMTQCRHHPVLTVNCERHPSEQVTINLSRPHNEYRHGRMQARRKAVKSVPRKRRRHGAVRAEISAKALLGQVWEGACCSFSFEDAHHSLSSNHHVLPRSRPLASPRPPPSWQTSPARRIARRRRQHARGNAPRTRPKGASGRRAIAYYRTHRRRRYNIPTSGTFIASCWKCHN